VILRALVMAVSAGIAYFGYVNDSPIIYWPLGGVLAATLIAAALHLGRLEPW
jgi:hypothetical protein